MHDFCLTIPYGLLVLAGGVMGYLKKGSTSSLAGGAGSGLLLLIGGYLSLKAFQKRRNSYIAMLLQSGIVLRFCDLFFFLWIYTIFWFLGADSCFIILLGFAVYILSLKAFDLRKWVAFNFDYFGSQMLGFSVWFVFILGSHDSSVFVLFEICLLCRGIWLRLIIKNPHKD